MLCHDLLGVSGFEMLDYSARPDIFVEVAYFNPLGSIVVVQALSSS
jgi:hypothetical protein